MSEKKKLPEQVAFHTYRKRQPVAARVEEQPHVESTRNAFPERQLVDKNVHVEARRELQRGQQRVVTVPDADPSRAWNTFSQRQKELRQGRTRPRTYVKMVQRTYAQTGVYASSGRIRAVRAASSAKAAPHSSPIPTRSGRRTRARRFWIRLISALFAIVCCLLAVRFVLTDSRFRIEQVNVEGTHNVALAQSIQRIDMRGQNIFFVNVSALTERIAALPLVDSAKVSKQLPNRLTISIVERRPVLLWQTQQGTYSVDKHGVVIAAMPTTTGTAKASMLPMVSNVATQQKATPAIRPGTHLDAAEIRFATTALADLPKVVGTGTFKLYYDGTIDASNHGTGGAGSRGSYIVDSPEGWRAYLGDATDVNPLGNRLIELQQILLAMQKQHLNVATIDLRYGLRPVYTLK